MQSAKKFFLSSFKRAVYVVVVRKKQIQIIEDW